MKKLLLLLVIIPVFLTCKKKDDNHPIIPPPPDDTTDYIIPETKDIIMYEVNLRALSATGNFAGVTGRLGEMAKLGVNVIWLMPIYPIGEVNSVNSPYCVKNYKEVNPEFGSLNDLKTLVKEAHKKDMAIILDWVANHTAWDNPWIENTDWYTQDGQGNIVHPPGTNWLDVADLDYSSLSMRLNMIDAMEYWVENADIDGYRCDAADMVPIDFWKQAIDSVNGATEKKLIWLAEGGNINLFSAGFQMNYAWNYYSKIKDVIRSNHAATTLVMVHDQEYSGLPAGKQKLRFTTNHDESAWDATPMSLFYGEKGALAASVAAIFLGGVPLVYGSQEVGVLANVPFFSNTTIDWSQNPSMLNAYQDMLNFYDSTDAVKKGTMASYATLDVLAFTRTSGQVEILVLDNMRNKTVTFNVNPEMQSSTWKNVFDGTAVTLGETVELGNYEYVILRRDL